MGMPDLIKPGGWGYEHEVFLQMEQGRISDQAFRDGIRNLLPIHAPDREIDQAWCAMILDFRAEKIRLLHQLRSTYRLFLFSNTNAIHVNHFRDLFLKEFGYPIDDLFDKVYYSNRMGVRKPKLQAFQHVLNDAGLNANETLFIDDSEENVQGARQTGMQAIHFTAGTDLSCLL